MQGAIVSFMIIFLAWFLTSRGVNLSIRYGFIREFILIVVLLIMGFPIIAYHPHRLPEIFINIFVETAGLALIFTVFSNGGFETAGNPALENKDKRKVAPIIMILSVVIAMAFFVFLSYVIILEFDNNIPLLWTTAAPFYYIGMKMGIWWMGPLTDIVMALALISGYIGIFNTVSRTFYSMGVHSILPDAFADLHFTYKTPAFANSVAFFVIVFLFHCSY